MIKLLQNFFFKKVSPFGLGVFRAVYSLVLLLEARHLYKFRELYFHDIPYFGPNYPNNGLLLSLWISIIILLIVGYRTFLISIINYIFTLIFISSAVSYEYHMFYTYTGINLLLIFLPVGNAFSIDYLLKKRYLIKAGIFKKSYNVSKLNYFLPVFMGLALVYFDSAYVFKLNSPGWLNGLGIWLPSSLPQIAISKFQWILNEESLIKFLSYFVFGFELLFIFLFWFKKFRIPILVIGFFLHIGIYISYPIPFFALGCLSIYILVIPISYWQKIRFLFFRNIENITSEKKIEDLKKVFFSGEVVVTPKIESVARYNLSFFKRFIVEDSFRYNIKEKLRNVSLTLILLFAILAQFQFYYSFFKKSKVTTSFNINLLHYTGITGHPVFMDSHFRGYQNLYTLKYKDQFLPILDENGMPGEYLKGGTWINWIWRVNGPYVKQNSYSLRQGFTRFSSFWAFNNNINLRNKHIFEIVKKQIISPKKWEKNLLTKNMNAKWESVGKLVWENNQTRLIWNSTPKK